MTFLRAADRAGLSIPHDSPELRGHLYTLNRQPSDDWPDADVLAVVALAQHYGISTRLLDWTYRPLVAAYFAAAALAKEASGARVLSPRYVPEGKMVIWALNTDLFPHHVMGRAGRRRFSIVEAPQATNPNLAAQAGIFTLDREAIAGVGLETTLSEAAWPTGPPPLSSGRDPLFRKFTLRHTQARRLLRLLGLRAVSAATVFPGHKGVVESLHEETLYWEQ